MIPSIEDIIAALLRGATTPEQAIADIQNHVDMERGDLREMFAAQALQGILAAHASAFAGRMVDADEISKKAFAFADAMLRARRAA